MSGKRNGRSSKASVKHKAAASDVLNELLGDADDDRSSSDVSDADPAAIAATLSDMDKLDKDIFGKPLDKNSRTGSKKNVEKPKDEKNEEQLDNIIDELLADTDEETSKRKGSHSCKPMDKTTKDAGLSKLKGSRDSSRVQVRFNLDELHTDDISNTEKKTFKIPAKFLNAGVEDDNETATLNQDENKHSTSVDKQELEENQKNIGEKNTEEQQSVSIKYKDTDQKLKPSAGQVEITHTGRSKQTKKPSQEKVSDDFGLDVDFGGMGLEDSPPDDNQQEEAKASRNFLSDLFGKSSSSIEKGPGKSMTNKQSFVLDEKYKKPKTSENEAKSAGQISDTNEPLVADYLPSHSKNRPYTAPQLFSVDAINGDIMKRPQSAKVQRSEADKDEDWPAVKTNFHPNVISRSKESLKKSSSWLGKESDNNFDWLVAQPKQQDSLHAQTMIEKDTDWLADLENKDSDNKPQNLYQKEDVKKAATADKDVDWLGRPLKRRSSQKSPTSSTKVGTSKTKVTETVTTETALKHSFPSAVKTKTAGVKSPRIIEEKDDEWLLKAEPLLKKAEKDGFVNSSSIVEDSVSHQANADEDILRSPGRPVRKVKEASSNIAEQVTKPGYLDQPGQLQHSQLKILQQQQLHLAHQQFVSAACVTPSGEPEEEPINVPTHLYSGDTRYSMAALPEISAFSQFNKELVELQQKISQLELEKSILASELGNAKKRHTFEIEAVELSFKKRLELAEESHHKREELLKEEISTIKKYHDHRIELLEQERKELIATNLTKQDLWQKEKENEITRLQEFHRMAILEMRSEHEETLKRQKQTHEQELAAILSTQVHTKSIQAVVNRVEENAKSLDALQQQMELQHKANISEQQMDLQVRDSQIKMLQERLGKQQEDNAVESEHLQKLIMHLEVQLREQSQMQQQEKWQLAKQQNKVHALQDAVEAERKMMMEQIERERGDIQQSKEALLQEQKTVLAQLYEERKALAAERTQFKVNQKFSSDMQKEQSFKHTESKAKLDALAKELCIQKQNFAEQQAELHKQKSELAKRQQMLDKQKEEQREELERLQHSSRQLQLQQAEVEQSSLSSQKQKEETERTLEKLTRQEAKLNNKENLIQDQLLLLRNREKRLNTEKLEFDRMNQGIGKVVCNSCKLLLNDPVNLNQDFSVAAAMLLTTAKHPDTLKPKLHCFDDIGNDLTGNGYLTSLYHTSPEGSYKWKLNSSKDKQFLEEESRFLAGLRHSPYHSTSNI